MKYGSKDKAQVGDNITGQAKGGKGAGVDMIGIQQKGRQKMWKPAHTAPGNGEHGCPPNMYKRPKG